MKHERMERIRFLPGLSLVIILFAVFFCELPVFSKAFFPKKAKSVEKRIAQVRKKCAEKFPLRESWVTLNGGFVRVIGQHSVRGVVKSKEGVLLTPSANRVNAEAMARRTCRFARFCASEGARFAYVQLPKKLDLGKKMLPPGLHDFAYDHVDRIVRTLCSDGSFPVYDWRSRFAATPKDVAGNFYHTDHHWNTDTSFAAAGILAEQIAGLASASDEVRAAVAERLDVRNWTREVRHNLFLGSRGRQTGPLFSGLDDVVVLKPKFHSEQTFSVPSKKLAWHGSFEETVMRQEREIGMRGMFSDDAYSILYSGLGVRYPLVVHANADAPLRCTVVLIGDSFARPVEGFLSLVVSRLYAIDPRRPSSGTTVAKLVRDIHPDVVVHLQSSISFLDKLDAEGRQVGGLAMFNYGLDAVVGK